MIFRGAYYFQGDASVTSLDRYANDTFDPLKHGVETVEGTVKSVVDAFVTSLDHYAKDRSDPLELSVETVEGTVKEKIDVSNNGKSL
ncbi:hypothetical protein GH714_034728 [Hevea brasiliensis]|uniref:Uncharacterized protein n=1 Tax=Hevea brasiliensis TaxID=3981 RepID=A0A6A6KWH7_HEVBR|nr:hypothetical protein GH714_034728 [Hevea brasiliensis]